MKFIIVLIIIAGAFSYLNSSKQSKSTTDRIQKPERMQFVEPELEFECDGREHCSDMNSYEEALYFINNCPNTKMDGDNDGIPCERQFGRH